MSTHLSILNVDRISNLPDSIICNILSFLPTKLSASTSILSKRWNPLWSSLLTLHFDDTDFADFATFRHFVYSVMLTRDITLPLQYFHLKCGTSLGCDPHDINRFVCAAAQRRIQNLILELSNTNYTFLAKLGPTISGIFSSKNLVVLKLKRLVVKVLPKIDFPLLKTLHLEKVFFRRDFDKLIDGCHVLEELHIITVLCMSLKDYNGEVKHLPNLVRAKIKIFDVNFIRWNFPFAWICNATFLRLKLYSEMQEQKDYTFHNLTYLKLSSRVNLQIKCKWLVEMLEHCPKIQNLILHQGSSCGNEIGDEDWMDPPIVPKCLSSQLRTCLFKGYKGMTCEFQLAKFILKNAKVLHTMTISASPVDINIKHQMLMKLSLCSRGSTTCKLSFE